MKTVLNLKNPSNKGNKLFLGEPLGICNFADMKYPIFKQIYDTQLSFFWRPSEISMVKDCSDINVMSKVQRSVFEKNIAFQTMGDSFLGQGIEGVLSHVTNNELYQTLTVHAFFESSIHTPSYSHIFENIYNDPAAKFYEILNDQEIVGRAKESTDRFNKLLNFDGNDPRRHIVNTIIGLLVLESVSFFNSFLTSFYFAKNGMMSGTGSIISLIARDEFLHKSNSVNILNILCNEPSEGFSDLKEEIQHNLKQSIGEMVNQEDKWIDYLLSEGELPGLTKSGLKMYARFLAETLCVQLKLNHTFGEHVYNPYAWVNSFQSSSKSTQVAPQEQQLTAYVKSSKNDINSMFD